MYDNKENFMHCSPYPSNIYL
uniref:Uncharacterized protein n=1 Tax=Arundo donax TaxID=35708 RepID=A0A0A9B7B1_ARUDO